MAYAPVPIIIPIEHKRNCITVKEKLFCEDEKLTSGEAQAAGFIVLFLIVWMVALYWAADRGENLGMWVLLSPIAALGLFLIFGVK